MAIKMSFGSWRGKKFGYAMEGKLDYKEIKSKAKEQIEKTTKGAEWRYYGTIHVPLPICKCIIEELWEDISPKELMVGAFWYERWGTKVRLMKNEGWLFFSGYRG